MPRGGKRDGAGRKQGATSQRTREIAEKAIKSGGLTPLEVMLQVMRKHFKAQRWDDAAAVAKDAAPYMHPRLAAVEHSGPNGGPIEYEEVRRTIVDPTYKDT